MVSFDRCPLERPTPKVLIGEYTNSIYPARLCFVFVC